MALPHNPMGHLGGEDFVSCPFNKEHWMTESSLQRHVIRCMVNYPNYVACPYNALHFFRNIKLLEKHMPVCPCKPTSFDQKERQEELIHGGDLYNVRYWSKILETWDD